MIRSAHEQFRPGQHLNHRMSVTWPSTAGNSCLTADAWHRGRGKYPITAYSEFMPPPRLGRKPYGSIDAQMCHDDDPFGWHLTEYEQQFELIPGWQQIACQVVTVLAHLGRGEPAHGIAKAQAGRQSLLAGGDRWRRRPNAMSFCRPGILQDARRQGTRPLDAVRRQRARAGQGVLASFFTAPRKRVADRAVARFYPPLVGRGLWRRSRPV